MELRPIDTIPKDGYDVLIRVKGSVGMHKAFYWCGDFVDGYDSYHATVFKLADIVGWIPMPYVPDIKKKIVKFD